MEQYLRLLEKVDVLRFKYEQVLKDSQHQFNIFSILHSETDEMYLHSRFLFELLNPRGSHNQGNRFLKLFLQQLVIPETAYAMQNTVIRKEYEKIDLLLTNGSQAIIIENKIHAEDQKRQLERYHKTLVRDGYQPENILVLYLTLDGREPSRYSLGRLNPEDVILVSYQQDIIDWLAVCIQGVALQPTLRETLVQYQELLKKLTGQTLIGGYLMEIKELLQQADNLRLALHLSEALAEARVELQYAFWVELERALAKRGYRISEVRKYTRRIVEKFYTANFSNRYYGLTIDLGKIEQKYDLYYFVQVNHHLNCGFILGQHGNLIQIPAELNVDGLVSIIHTIDPEMKRDNWWLGHKHPAKDVNFWTYAETDQFIGPELIEESRREEYINTLANDTDYLLKNFISKARDRIA